MVTFLISVVAFYVLGVLYWRMGWEAAILHYRWAVLLSWAVTVARIERGQQPDFLGHIIRHAPSEYPKWWWHIFPSAYPDTPLEMDVQVELSALEAER